MVKFKVGESIVFVRIESIQSVWVHPNEVSPKSCLFQVVTSDRFLSVTESDYTVDQLVDMISGL